MSVLSSVLDHIKVPTSSSIPSSSVTGLHGFKIPSSTSTHLTSTFSPAKSLDLVKASTPLTGYSSLSTTLTKTPLVHTTPSITALSPVKLHPSLELPPSSSLSPHLPVKPDLDLAAFRPDLHVPDLTPHVTTSVVPKPAIKPEIVIKPIVEPDLHLPSTGSLVGLTPSSLIPSTGLIDNPFHVKPIDTPHHLVDGAIKPPKLDFGSSILDHLLRPTDGITRVPHLEIPNLGTVELGHLSPPPLKPREVLLTDGGAIKGIPSISHEAIPGVRALIDTVSRDTVIRHQIMLEHIQAQTDAINATLISSPTTTSRTSSTTPRTVANTPSRTDALAFSAEEYENTHAIDEALHQRSVKKSDISARNYEHETTLNVAETNSQNNRIAALAQQKQHWTYGKTTYNKPVANIPRPLTAEYA